MIRKTAVSLVLGAAFLTALAGCSSTSTPGPTSSPKPSHTTPVTETVYNECVDGLATVDASDLSADEPFTLGDCAQVSVLGAAKDGGTISLGAVDSLLVEASGATIEVQGAKTITIPGSDNTVTYGGTAEVQDLGTGNTATAH